MKSKTIKDIRAEIMRARKKFPENEHQLAALTEEVGELAQALIDNSMGTLTPNRVYWEAIQVAAMAIRVAEEGDRSFPYRYESKY